MLIYSEKFKRKKLVIFRKDFYYNGFVMFEDVNSPDRLVIRVSAYYVDDTDSSPSNSLERI